MSQCNHRGSWGSLPLAKTEGSDRRVWILWRQVPGYLSMSDLFDKCLTPGKHNMDQPPDFHTTINSKFVPNVTCLGNDIVRTTHGSVNIPVVHTQMASGPNTACDCATYWCKTNLAGQEIVTESGSAKGLDSHEPLQMLKLMRIHACCPWNVFCYFGDDIAGCVLFMFWKQNCPDVSTAIQVLLNVTLISIMEHPVSRSYLYASLLHCSVWETRLL